MMRIPIFIFIIWTGTASAQNEKSINGCSQNFDSLTNREVFKTVEVRSKIIGGVDKLFSEIVKTLKAPKDFTPTQTKIIIGFIVETNGEVTGLRTIKMIEGTDLDKQLINLMGNYKWEPGTCNGIKVPTFEVFHMIMDFK